jgi:hypothetical protein
MAFSGVELRVGPMSKPPADEPRENVPTSPAEAEVVGIFAPQDLLEFEFKEVFAVPRLNRSCLACS